MSQSQGPLRIKRVYDPPADEDGVRVLVDRLWPRGLTKDRAAVDIWLKEIAPSTQLRKRFGHMQELWSEFQQEYRTELGGNDENVGRLMALASDNETVTLLFGASDRTRNQAVVLLDYMNEKLANGR